MNYVKIILLTAILAGSGVWFWINAHRLANLRRERDDLTVRLSLTTQNLEAIQTLSKAQGEAIAKNLDIERSENERLRKVYEFLASENKPTGCPLPPVVRGTLDRLRHRTYP